MVNNWILIQQNVLSGAPFNVPWSTYQTTFGNFTTNYWMGLENVYLLTSSNNYMLRIEMLSNLQGWISAEYDMFQILSAEYFYEIYLNHPIPPPATGTYYGDGGDSLQCLLPDVTRSYYPPIPPPATFHGFMPFETSDTQTGPWNCATSNKGGWWYNKGYCVYGLLNTDTASSFVWDSLNPPAGGSSAQLTISRMMIKLV